MKVFHTGFMRVIIIIIIIIIITITGARGGAVG